MYIDEVIYIGQLLHNTCMVIELELIFVVRIR